MKENTENRGLPVSLKSRKKNSNSEKAKINLNTGKDKKDLIVKIPEEVPVIKEPKEFEKTEGATIRFAMTMFQYEP